MEHLAARDNIKRLAGQAKTAMPGSPEYRALEEFATRCYVEGSETGQLAARQTAKLAAERVYHQSCEKVLSAVADYAREQQLELVINSTPTGFAERSCCGLPSCNHPPRSRVIYSACPDITSAIVKRLNTNALP
jgi:hypothetical protein